MRTSCDLHEDSRILFLNCRRIIHNGNTQIYLIVVLAFSRSSNRVKSNAEMSRKNIGKYVTVEMEPGRRVINFGRVGSGQCVTPGV